MNHLEAISKLEQDGFVIWNAFLNTDELIQLNQDFELLRSQGRFKRAGIGKADDHHLNDAIRSDETCWIETESPTSAQAMLLQKLEDFKQAINQELFLGLWNLEGHYAHYPIGGKYEAHLDRFSKDDARTLSMVLYLNVDWNPEHGGELRIHREAQKLAPMDVAPLGGRLVCFFSESVLHEVRPGKQERRSFAGWWKRR